MTKSYRIQNLDCGNCTAKIERAAKKLDGVNNINISFLTQRLTLDVVEDKAVGIIGEIQKIIDKIEPGAKIIV